MGLGPDAGFNQNPMLLVAIISGRLYDGHDQHGDDQDIQNNKDDRDYHDDHDDQDDQNDLERDELAPYALDTKVTKAYTVNASLRP